MFRKFLQTIHSLGIDPSADKVLLAVSGGVDSMVLTHLFMRTGISIGIAHINHRTRNGQSDADARFVNEYCTKNALVCHYAVMSDKDKAHGNFQDLAHHYRYAFFRKTADKQRYTHIVTAHHRDDQTETILMNILRGNGVHGMPEVTGQITRPLLHFTKKDIVAYAKNNNITYVSDTSNEIPGYTRNFLRLEIIPRLENLFPHLSQRLLALAERQSDDAALMEEVITSFIPRISQGNKYIYNISDLLNFSHNKMAVYHVFKKYGMNRAQAEMVTDNWHTPGRFVHTKTHEILIDRNTIIVCPLSDKSDLIFMFSPDENPILELPGALISATAEDSWVKTDDQKVLFVSEAVLNFPLTVRRWKPGDRFQPFGMNGASKKVKKFFTDEKVDRFSKHEKWLILSDNEIIWIAGMRASELTRFNRDDPGPFWKFVFEDISE